MSAKETIDRVLCAVHEGEPYESTGTCVTLLQNETRRGKPHVRITQYRDRESVDMWLGSKDLPAVLAGLAEASRFMVENDNAEAEETRIALFDARQALDGRGAARAAS